MNAKFLDEIVFDVGTNLESNGFSRSYKALDSVASL